MHRRWRVRHSYPQPVVELVRLLLPTHAVRDISILLDIPMSVIYRWRALEHSDALAGGQSFAAERRISSAFARCHELGFRFKGLPAVANDPLQLSSVPSSSAPLPEDAVAVSQQPPDAGARHRDDSDPDAARSVAGHRSDARTPDQQHMFDARKERSARRVRQRLEAARRLIDAEYFLEIDCRILAATAQMSRYHFIRSFSHRYGLTPHQYLIRTRVEAAKRLLLASREPIDVIAAGVGFRSGQSLNRAFKQAEGMSVSGFCGAVAKPAAARRDMSYRTPGAEPAHARASEAIGFASPLAYAPSPAC